MRRKWNEFPPYVPVSERVRRNRMLADALSRNGESMRPVVCEGSGRKLARSFWGDRWCRHLESFSDYSNRLPRGRSYLRCGAVVDLQIREGLVTALVSGSALYHVEISIEPPSRRRRRAIRSACSGRIGSLLELLEGTLSDEVMSVVTDPERGMLPRPGEIRFDCDCPDWAVMCKHVAATLFGVGVRLDEEPELLFTLRGMDPQDLVSGDLALPGDDSTDPTDPSALAEADLADIFGIEFDTDPARDAEKPLRRRAGARKKATAPAIDGESFVPSGAAIRSLRNDFGLSVEEFADVLDVSQASVYRWERVTGQVKLQARLRRRLEHLAAIRTEILSG